MILFKFFVFYFIRLYASYGIDSSNALIYKLIIYSSI